MSDLPWFWRPVADPTWHGPHASRRQAKADAQASGWRSGQITLTRREEVSHG